MSIFDILKKKQRLQKEGLEAKEAITSTIADARGYTTTEFWLVIILIAASIIEQSSGAFPNSQYMGYAAIVAAFIYKIGRFMLKMRRAKAIEGVDEVVAELEDVFDELQLLTEQVKGRDFDQRVFDEEVNPTPDLRATPIAIRDGK